MHIETTSEMIIHNTPYRQPPAIEEEMNKEVQEMLEAGLIRKDELEHGVHQPTGVFKLFLHNFIMKNYK